MLRQQAEAGPDAWIAPWAAYADLLPGVLAFLRTRARGVAVLVADDVPSLLYVYSRGDKDFFYRGQLPLGDGREEALRLRNLFFRLAVVALLPAYRSLNPEFFAWLGQAAHP